MKTLFFYLLLLVLIVHNSILLSHTVEDGIASIRDDIHDSVDNFDTSKSCDFPSPEMIQDAVNEASKIINSQYPSQRRLFDDVTSLNMYGSMMAAKQPAIQLSRRSKVLAKASEIMVERCGFEILEELQKIDSRRFIEEEVPECLEMERKCDVRDRFRTYSGYCNNLEEPSKGMAFQPLTHLLPPFVQGIEDPHTHTARGRPLASPRLISNTVHYAENYQSKQYTSLFMQFGQFLDHEITHSPVEMSSSGRNLNCSRCDSTETISPSCWPIRVPEDDQDFNGRRCLPFVRSIAGQRGFGPRSQMNQITSYIDGSVVYGSTKCDNNRVRLFRRGLLKFVDGGDDVGILPPKNPDQSSCSSAARSPCFLAGDDRNSQQPPLATLQTIFLRHHNRLAGILGGMNQHWDDERIFQETRRIVSAQLPHIVYSEFLPIVLGDQMMFSKNLKPQTVGFFDGYDASCSSGISQPFATAAFRFGHSLVRRFFPRLSSTYANVTEPMDISMNFNDMSTLYDGRIGGVDSLLSGLVSAPSMALDRHVSDAVRNRLFATGPQPGFDLISINIQRARDHNVKGYNEHRQLCGKWKVSSFEELHADMNPSSVDALRQVYEHVDDIELFPGIVSERIVFGGVIGPTGACIIAEQFERLKKCDRFFYENNFPTGFTSDQLNEIRKTTLASILCSNSRINHIQPNVFQLPDEFRNNRIACQFLPQPDLRFWKE